MYQQHSRYLLSKHIHTSPRTQLLQDLQVFIQDCLHHNEQLIVMGDLNEPITQAPISTFFSDLGLHNILLNHLEAEYFKLPYTYARGRQIIDGVFATAGISATRGGYLPSHTFDSDHTPIWFDLNLSSVFGTNHNIQLPLQCRRLKNEDPRTVAAFNNAYHKLLNQYRLPEALSHLRMSITTSLTPQQQEEYERLDKVRVSCLLQAEKKCRKLRTGSIEFSPTIQHQRNLIRFWKLILKRRSGQKIDSKYLSRWERKLSLQHTFQTPLNDIHQHIKTQQQPNITSSRRIIRHSGTNG